MTEDVVFGRISLLLYCCEGPRSRERMLPRFLTDFDPIVVFVSRRALSGEYL